jgi:predicted DNA-binding antitoxin AbrB/MazE fold protein
MTETIEATFDGSVFRPEQPVKLKPNTRVRIIFETELDPDDGKISFLRTARELKLNGPPDWSENIDGYLYDKTVKDEQNEK